jgi:hypothetical protein
MNECHACGATTENNYLCDECIKFVENGELPYDPDSQTCPRFNSPHCFVDFICKENEVKCISGCGGDYSGCEHVESLSRENKCHE